MVQCAAIGLQAGAVAFTVCGHVLDVALLGTATRHGGRRRLFDSYVPMWCVVAEFLRIVSLVHISQQSSVPTRRMPVSPVLHADSVQEKLGARVRALPARAIMSRVHIPRALARRERILYGSGRNAVRRVNYLVDAVNLRNIGRNHLVEDDARGPT